MLTDGALALAPDSDDPYTTSGDVALWLENRVRDFLPTGRPRLRVTDGGLPDGTGDFPVDVRQLASAKPYAYVGGNPLNDTDPSGLFSLGDVGGAIGGAAGFVGDVIAHPCIRTGGGDFNSNTTNGCQTAFSGKQGLIGVGVCAAAIASIGAAAAAASGGAAAVEEAAAASRLTFPARLIPAGETQASWGSKVWGSGAEDAQGLIGARSASELRALGLDVPGAQQLANFYRAAAAAGRGGATAPARARLMDDIVKQLGGG